MSALTVSVIIPALNEADGIAATLASVAGQPGLHDVIVVDGGSDDDTAGAVRAAMPSATVLASGRGRAHQMNVGAEAATGNVLLFLHADTQLPSDALRRVAQALTDAGTVGGCFQTRFGVDETSLGPLGRGFMRLWAGRMWMRWHRFAFGDRAIFARRDAFEAAGRYPEQPMFEDLDLVRALRQQGRFAFIEADVVTSARRFERHGAVRQQLRNLGLWLGWNVGISGARLKRFYSDQDRG